MSNKRASPNPPAKHDDCTASGEGGMAYVDDAVEGRGVLCDKFHGKWGSCVYANPKPCGSPCWRVAHSLPTAVSPTEKTQRERLLELWPSCKTPELDLSTCRIETLDEMQRKIRVVLKLCHADRLWVFACLSISLFFTAEVRHRYWHFGRTLQIHDPDSVYNWTVSNQRKFEWATESCTAFD